MTAAPLARGHKPTHRAPAPEPGDEQLPPVTFPDTDRCWAVYQGKRCAEHAAVAS